MKTGKLLILTSAKRAQVWWSVVPQKPFLSGVRGRDYGGPFPDVDSARNNLLMLHADISRGEIQHHPVNEAEHPDYLEEYSQFHFINFRLPLDELTDQFTVKSANCSSAKSLADSVQFQLTSKHADVQIMQSRTVNSQLQCLDKVTQPESGEEPYVEMSLYVEVNLRLPRVMLFTEALQHIDASVSIPDYYPEVVPGKFV